MKRGSRKHKIIDYYLGIILVFFSGLLKKVPRLGKRKSFTPAEANRILFIKLAAVGDSLLFISIIKAYKQKFPSATIDILASPINEDILKGVPFINKIWVLPIGGKHSESGGFLKLDRKSTRLNSSHIPLSRMPSSA